MEKNNDKPNRRELFRAAGAGAISLAAPLASCGGSAETPIHNRPWWVRTVDKPTLGETAPDYGRFHGRNMFSLYRGLKEERDGKGAFQAVQKDKRERIARWIREGKPGCTLRDYALVNAGWTVHRAGRAGADLLSWTRSRGPTPEGWGVERYDESPEEAATTVKAAARVYGAALVGIAPMRESYVNQTQMSRPIVFEEVDTPAVAEEKFVIPKKMKWVVSIAVQMNQELLTRSPTPLGETATTVGYSHCTFAVASLAEFIRALGYEAIPSVNDTAQSVPFAVEAGLGELSRTNRLVTPEFGPCVRLAKVFTDLPMAYDQPIDFGAVEFCKRCKKCAEACPTGALSMDDEPSYEVKGPWNNPGHKAWYEDSYKCFEQWQLSTTDCGICFRVCPYTKAAEAWIHDMVKPAASLVPAADPFFRAMDDAFGYGRQHDPEAWWSEDNPAFGIDTRRGNRG